MFSIRARRTSRGTIATQVLDVLANDHGPGNFNLYHVGPDTPDVAMRGRVEVTSDHLGVRYTAQYTGSPFIDRFKYTMQSGNPEVGVFEDEAVVEVAVGECGLLMQYCTSDNDAHF